MVPLDEWWYNRFVSSVFLTTKTCELIHCCYTNLLICVWPPHFRSITQLNRHINYCWLGDFCESCRWWMLKLPDRFNGSVRELWHANVVLLKKKKKTVIWEVVFQIWQPVWTLGDSTKRFWMKLFAGECGSCLEGSYHKTPYTLTQ